MAGRDGAGGVRGRGKRLGVRPPLSYRRGWRRAALRAGVVVPRGSGAPAGVDRVGGSVEWVKQKTCLGPLTGRVVDSPEFGGCCVVFSGPAGQIRTI